jgi:hypothetical protein
VVVQSHTQIPTFKSTDGQPKPTGSIWVKSTAPNLGAKFKVKKFNGTTLAFEDISAPLYANNETALYNLDRTGGGINIPVGDLYVNANNSSDEVDFLIKRKENSGATIVKSSAITTQALVGTYSFTIQESTTGSSALSTGSGNGIITVTTTGLSGDADTIAAAINAEGFVNVEASVTL